MPIAQAYAAPAADQPLGPFQLDRRDPRPNDVAIRILFCGVCHSDLHTARGEWGGTRFPCVPGHEITGEVTAVGGDVTRFKTGDLVGVGCMVDSCLSCPACREGLEQYCEPGFTGTYGGPEQGTGANTFGGYSDSIVVREEFVLSVRHPREQLAAVAPLLCAGITTWSPLRKWGAGPGRKVGIVGIGGLGHMGVKLAHALGAHTVGFTSSPAKRDAILALGADEVIVSRDRDQMRAHAGSFHLIIDTIGAPHDIDSELQLLARDGALVLVGGSPEPHPSPNVFSLLMRRRTLAGSLIGGVAETQEMLDFCAEHNIVSDIELIDIKAIHQAYDRMLKGDVRYRFVIDMATL